MKGMEEEKWRRIGMEELAMGRKKATKTETDNGTTTKNGRRHFIANLLLEMVARVGRGEGRGWKDLNKWTKERKMEGGGMVGGRMPK